uniref:Uncharacterized protein n=1 Tax=Lotharella globosa TaxID=91324 RepID=A0A7S4DMN3_9EUKA
MSKPESLLHMLTRKGYLQRFVVELLHPKREAFLKEAINSVQMRHYEQIITYEILASLLTKVALREEGSLALLRLNVVSRLRECSFLGSYPEPSFRELSAMHMSPSTRYYQLFISTFQLVSCMLTSQPTNALLRRQAATLLDAHSTTLEKILDEARLILSSDTRQRHFAPSTSDQNVAAALQAAQLITGLVATLETSRGGGGLAKDLSHHYNALVQKMSRNVRDLMKSDRMLLERNGPDKNILLMYEITRNVMLVLASRTSRLGKVARGKENVGIVGGHNVGNMDVKVNQTVPWDMKVEGTDDNDGTLKLDDLVAMLKSIRQLNRQGYTGDRDMQMFGLHRLSEQIVEMTLQLIASHFQRGKDQQQRHRDLRKQLDEISTSYKGKFIQAMVRRIKKNPSMYSYE